MTLDGNGSRTRRPPLRRGSHRSAGSGASRWRLPRADPATADERASSRVSRPDGRSRQRTGSRRAVGRRRETIGRRPRASRRRLRVVPDHRAGDQVADLRHRAHRCLGQRVGLHPAAAPGSTSWVPTRIAPAFGALIRPWSRAVNVCGRRLTRSSASAGRADAVPSDTSNASPTSVGRNSPEARSRTWTVRPGRRPVGPAGGRSADPGPGSSPAARSPTAVPLRAPPVPRRGGRVGGATTGPVWGRAWRD